MDELVERGQSDYEDNAVETDESEVEEQESVLVECVAVEVPLAVIRPAYDSDWLLKVDCHGEVEKGPSEGEPDNLDAFLVTVQIIHHETKQNSDTVQDIVDGEG